jgi:hypothetical protein
MSICVFRGQGCSKDGRFGVIVRYAAEVDGEQFVVVKFRDGEQLLSVLELLPATQVVDYVPETEIEEEEEVFGEAAEEQSLEALDMSGLFSRDELEGDEEELEEAFAEEQE